MSKLTLIDSRIVGRWYIDLWSNGTMDLFSTKRSESGMHCLWPNMSIDSQVPKYVREAAYAMRDKYRSTQRLHRSYRLGAHFAKARRVYWDRYMHCENGGEWFKPMSSAVGYRYL